jgi:hypothetical protein
MLYQEFTPTMLVRISHAFRQRRSEWIAAVQCVLFGFVLLAPAETFSGPSFVVFREIMPEAVWGGVIASIGVVRLAGLIINGARRRITPWMRLGGAILGCGVFTLVSVCFALSGVLSVWLAAWPVLAVVEMLNIQDTARDARQAYG